MSTLSLLLEWRRRRRRRAVTSTLAQVAAAEERLAARQRAAWQAQVRRRGIDLPAPVPVRWCWAPAEFGIDQHELVAPGRAAGPDVAGRPADPAGTIAGSGLVSELYDDVYGRLPAGPMVLVGAEGAGKTGALILLALAAFEHRGRAPERDRPDGAAPPGAGEPVPVRLGMGSWDPGRQPLRDWVLQTLVRDHPYLRAAEFGPDAVEQLVETNRVALFLDGLDELPESMQQLAINRLNLESGGLRVVLTSRTDAYRRAVARRPLTLAAVLELQPVDPKTAARYLLSGLTGPARARWHAVADHLVEHPGSVLAQALTTPLALTLVRAAYAAGRPAALLSDAFDSAVTLRHHLLDWVLTGAYPDPAERARVAFWLGWLAHHLGQDRDLPWWRIPCWIGPWPFRVPFGLVGGAIFGTVVGYVPGAVVGIAVAAASGRPAVPRTFAPRWPDLRDLRSRLASGLIGGAGAGVAFGTMVGLVFQATGVHDFVTGLGAGACAGSVGGLLNGLLSTWNLPTAEDGAATPHSTYRRDVRSRLAGSLTAGLVVGLGAGLTVGSFTAAQDGLVVGTGSALLVAFVIGIVQAASTRLFLAEVALSIRHGRRVRFVAMLETALDRQVLRQAGAVYQFRHGELQERLARRHRAVLGERAGRLPARPGRPVTGRPDAAVS